MTATPPSSPPAVTPSMRCLGPLAVVLACLCLSAQAEADPLGLQEEAAFRTAVDRVAAAVVRIEPTGVSESAGGGTAEAAPATGPSTGVAVDADGWVIATTFAVPREAQQAIVVLPDGTRQAAQVVGRDLSRGLVLLKIDAATGKDLPVPEWAPRSGLAVGQWTLAIGRTWSLPTPSVAVGILSATQRAWGKAVQTDASVSPVNYGGPLIDIEGRVIGILAPLPADTAGMTSGTELYDSGIGFAVPMDDVIRVLPRLKEGQTLAPGILGIGYKSRDPFTAPATIATCRAGSPAAKAGLRSGDTVVEANGRRVSRIAELRHVIAPSYGGDTVALVVERRTRDGGTERVAAQATLVDKLPPWRRPVIGIVPARTSNADEKQADSGAGVRVDWLWPDGPAAKAGVVPGDVITAISEARADADPTRVTSAAMLSGFIGGTEDGTSLRLSIQREAETRSIDVRTTAMPVAVPATMPDATPAMDKATVERLEAPEVAKPPLAVLPAGTAKTPLGVLVFFGPPPGATDANRRAADAKAGAGFLDVWKLAAARHGIAVILPASTDPERWGRDDIAAVARALDSLRSRRPIDPARVAFAGRGAGAAFAWMAAEALGPAVRGVALLDAGLPRQATIEPTEPGRSRWVLFGRSAADSPPKIDADRKRLEDNGFPVGMLPEVLGDAPPADTLCRWVEALGVL